MAAHRVDSLTASVVAGECSPGIQRSPGVVTITYARVPEALRGRGVGSALAKGVLALVEQNGEKVVPRCWFIAGYMQRHPEVSHLLATQAESA